MDPVLAVKFLYGLTNTPQDLFAFRQRKGRVSLDQAEQSASEVRIDQNTFLFVVVNMHPKSMGARKFDCQALGQIVEGPRYMF